MEQFSALVAAYLAGTLDKAGMIELARLIKHDPAKRTLFQELQAQHRETPMGAPSDSSEPPPQPHAPAQPAVHPKRSSARSILLIGDELRVGDDMGVFRHFNNSWMNTSSHLLTVDTLEADRLARDHALKDCFNAPSTEQLEDFPHLQGRQWLNLHKRPSLALCDLAVAARHAGYDTAIIDGIIWRPWRLEQARRFIETHRPLLIGLTTTFIVTPKHVAYWVRRLKEIAPDVPIVLGGPTVRSHTELHGLADFAVFGDGEEPLLGIIEALEGRRPLDSVPFTAYRRPDGTFGYGPSSVDAARVGLDGKAYQTRNAPIPIADWTLYSRARSEVYPLELSRGCRYNCFYCNYDRGKYVRGLESIRDELLLNAKLGITRYRVVDSTFTDGPPGNRMFVQDVCKLMIDLDLGLEWSCFARADEVTDEVAALMRRAGCYAVFYGIESGDDDILKLMRKGHTAAEAARGVEITKRHGILSHANFVVGYPGETLETFHNTLEFIERVRPDTFTLGELFVSRDAPISGPRMEEFELEGRELQWKHKTMDNETASALCVEGAQRLVANGLFQSSEVLQSMFLAFGISPPELRECQRDGLVLSSKDSSPDARQAAQTRIDQVRQRVIDRLIADERAMEAAF